ncbi:SprT-like domain-containing protein [Bradyrhizobium iriomotense]|uniref:Peptidase n=1 Tax=Bradyrhizobium iriomotense TaxID=441950 RepID=A0ABQ6BCB3_9BRAD|nr:SprT-like domain-containing protein [Bradyrhizobium iriomotense]GLR89762.1 peptidase [Bradyrhizobium iriomotense]
MDAKPKPTQRTYGALVHAYRKFNDRLFAGELPNCLITVQHLRGAYGCFGGNRFISRDGINVSDQIILNQRFWGSRRSDAENLSTLVHEMVHLWQHHFGKTGRGGYHNRQFARKMFEVGLVTSDTGAPGGKPIGRVSHYIKDGGLFDQVCSGLLNTGYVIPYVELEAKNDTGLVRRLISKAESKTGYFCPNCDPPVRVWGKPRLKINCGFCEGAFVCDQLDQDAASLPGLDARGADPF